MAIQRSGWWSWQHLLMVIRLGGSTKLKPTLKSKRCEWSWSLICSVLVWWATASTESTLTHPGNAGLSCSKFSQWQPIATDLIKVMQLSWKFPMEPGSSIPQRPMSNYCGGNPADSPLECWLCYYTKERWSGARCKVLQETYEKGRFWKKEAYCAIHPWS